MEWSDAQCVLLSELLLEALEEDKVYLRADQQDALSHLLRHLPSIPPSSEELKNLEAFSMHFSESTGIRIRVLIEPWRQEPDDPQPVSPAEQE